MLKYSETNWQNEEGLETHSYQVTFSEVKAYNTIKEQKKRAQRLSLVNFLNDKERDLFLEICSRFKSNDEYFCYHKNKRFHATLLGFPVIKTSSYQTIREKIEQYCEGKINGMNIRFGLVRLGTKYEDGGTLKPVFGESNGTIVAVGDKPQNCDFMRFGNKLASFLLEDEVLNSILGKNFRRRFPTVWCTMGYYVKDFKITIELEKLFNEYKNLDSNNFYISCSELELGTSNYKDLRDWNVIQKFSI